MSKTLTYSLILLFILGGCRSTTQGSVTAPPVAEDSTSPPANSQDLATPHSIQEPQSAQTDEEIQQEIDACYANPDHPIGQQIAADYAGQTTYSEVMDWFCSGFEFEDILTALETADLSGYHAEILLTMLEYGQTWEEIWAEIGLK
ncbi:MAG: hypothetical protein JW757_00850 [Anaerolineales bacterium]|nr:hypothetical protein [Anaerolineales bacterium]